MTEYQTHAALVATLETEIVRLRAVNAELRSSIQAPIQPDTKLVEAARQAMEVLSELAEWESEGDPRHPASAAITALREALDAAPAASNHEAFKLGYAKGVDDAERRAKARGEQPAAVVKKPVSAIHLGWDRLDNGQLVATYFLPVAEMAAPKLYTAPKPARQPISALPDGDIVFFSDRGDAVSGYSAQRVREILLANGIGGEA